MIKQNKKPKGIIAIVSLLIVAGVTMTFAMSMLLDGVDNASLSLSSLYYENARINAITCLEDALLRIKKEEQFVNDLDYTISEDNSCSADIVWFEEVPAGFGMTEQLADLNVIGISKGFEREFRYELKIVKYDVNHSDGALEYMNTIDLISIEEIDS